MESPTDSPQHPQPDSSPGSPPIIPVVPTAKDTPPHAEVVAMISDPKSKNPPEHKPPTTTGEEDRKSAGQRSINLLWETTQARIAISIVAANILYAFVSPFMPTQAKEMAQVLSNALFAVMGFYFGRTNHTAQGGIGGSDKKESR